MRIIDLWNLFYSIYHLKAMPFALPDNTSRVVSSALQGAVYVPLNKINHRSLHNADTILERFPKGSEYDDLIQRVYHLLAHLPIDSLNPHARDLHQFTFIVSSDHFNRPLNQLTMNAVRGDSYVAENGLNSMLKRLASQPFMWPDWGLYDDRIDLLLLIALVSGYDAGMDLLAHVPDTDPFFKHYQKAKRKVEENWLLPA